MLTEKQIESNKEEFVSLVRDIKRDGIDEELLLKQLLNSDFFTAPATIKYNQSYKGGLCEHSLAVYKVLVKLNLLYGLEYDDTCLKIVGLFHDFSKMNFYSQGVRNQKVYSDSGSKYDVMGKYDWVSVPCYEIKEDRFVFGNHEDTSAFMVNTFIPLSIEEYVAIAHHHGGNNWDSTQEKIADIYAKYKLPIILHEADLVSTFGLVAAEGVMESNEQLPWETAE